MCDTGLPVALPFCHPVRDRVCSLVVGVEAWGVGSVRFPSPEYVPCPKGGDYWRKWGLLCTHRSLMCLLNRYLWLQCPFPLVIITDLVQGCGMDWASQALTWLGLGSRHCGCRKWNDNAATRDLGCCCGSLLQGPICPTSSAEFWYGGCSWYTHVARKGTPLCWSHRFPGCAGVSANKGHHSS